MLSVFPLSVTIPAHQLQRSHWIYSNQVTHLDDTLLSPTKCALVRIENTELWGIYCKTSLYSVRLFCKKISRSLNKHEDIDKEKTLVTSIAQQLCALNNEKRALKTPHNKCLRLLHGESDGIPGVIVDDYGIFFVVQSSSASGDFLVPFIVEALHLLCQETKISKPILEKSTGQVRIQAGLEKRFMWHNADDQNTNANFDSNAAVTVHFAGLSLEFQPEKSQKTGLFLDQKSNLELFHRLLSATTKSAAGVGRGAKSEGEGRVHETYTSEPSEDATTANSSGRLSNTQESGARLASRSVLDLCCYVGAWSATAAACGVCHFTCVDQDANALGFAKRNIEANHNISANQVPDPVTIDSRHGDVFTILSDLNQEKAAFDFVIADPPGFAKSKKHLSEAKIAYNRLIKNAGRLVKPGGFLVVCSCSQVLSEETFWDIICKALDPDSWLLWAKGQQSPDHTVGLKGGWSEYLKCYFMKRRE